MRDNVIRADPIRGRLLVRMEAILPGQAFPPNGISDWALLQREDALSGEGGSDVIRLMGPHIGTRPLLRHPVGPKADPVLFPVVL